MELEENLRELDHQIGQLRLDYERYFLGVQPREPASLRAATERQLRRLSSTPIQNTALRFRLQSIVSRYPAFKRQWDETLRKIETGTYARHQFKADLRDPATQAADSPAAERHADLFDQYCDAQRASGASARGLTRPKLEALVSRQRASLAARFGAKARFRFRIALEDGRPKLKARRISDGR
ncbi:MAG: MXAN_5187 C-terminal domain-containing protein [Myxococcota bacterium]|nr:MXAN_5187 C-terminal domain-containing protein [Myxococcota bacterium]